MGKSRKIAAFVLACALSMSLSACDTGRNTSESSAVTETAVSLSTDELTINETLENTVGGEHVIEANGTNDSYTNVKVLKSGDSEGDEADFYGENAAVFASDGAVLDLSEIVLESNGAHANGIFSYGEGTTVNVSDSVIETSGNCSGGLMTTGGGTMNASNLTIHTTGNSSAAIRSDRGGGTVTVDGGSYTTDGTGSPVVYSTADITVSNAAMESTASQGVVIEGSNSVTLHNVTLTADNNTKNSDKSDTYQAVMIYQSMSGDASEGLGTFTMDGGTLTNKNGDIFFVNNTVAQIDLSGASIVNEDSEGVFLRAEAAGWGNEGSNGGQVTLNAVGQTIDGDMLVDEVSSLNLYLRDGSSFNGAINPDGQQGDVYVELTNGSSWTLMGDSYISSLTCDADSIKLNGYKLYVNGEEYTEGTASTGQAIEVTVSGDSENGTPVEPPADGSQSPEMQGEAPADGSQPPEKPSDASVGSSADSSSEGTHKGKRPEKKDSTDGSGQIKEKPSSKPEGSE